MVLKIQELKPDYVLTALNEGEDTSKESNSNLKSLEEVLTANGFEVKTIKGTGTENHLVFVKLGEKLYQKLVEHEKAISYDIGVTAKNSTRTDRLRLIHQHLTHGSSDGGLGLTPLIGEWKFVTGITAVQDKYNDNSIADDLKAAFASMDFDTSNIKKTYGTQIGLYFEFAKFYSIALIPSAVLGCASYIKSKKSFSLTFTFVNLAWGTLFLILWNRRERYIVNFWGTQNSHLEGHATEQHIEAVGDTKLINDAKGIRFLKQLTFIPIALGFAAILVAYQLGCFVLEIFLSEIYDGPFKIFLTLLPVVLMSVFVPILTIVYNIVASKAIAWENHDNEYSRNNSSLIKGFVLNFLTTYMPLLITSFIYLPFAHLIKGHLDDIKISIASSVDEKRFYYKYLVLLKKQEEFTMNQERLYGQYNFFIITNQIIQLVMKYILPLVLKEAMKIFREKVQGIKPQEKKKKDSEELWIEKVRKSTELPVYDVNEDFRSLVLQYGLLIIFAPVWPLAPLVSIIFNFINFKLDLYKLSSAKYFKPSIDKRADSIHPWNFAIFGLTWLSSIISPVVTAFYRHGTKPPKPFGSISMESASINISSTAKLVLLLFFAEHSFLASYFILAKISSLFKTKLEWDHDLTTEDLKIRHEHFTANSTKIKVPELKIDLNNEEDIIQSPTNAYSTSVEKPIGSVNGNTAYAINEKNLVDYEVENDANGVQLPSNEGLEKVKEFGDRIIQTPDENGNLVNSTIDNNDHFEPAKEDIKNSETIDKPDTSDSFGAEDNNHIDHSHQADNILASSDSSFYNNSPTKGSAKVSRKKTSLKGLFKNKK